MKGIFIDVDKKDIEELLQELKTGKYLIPSFQRQYVWDEDDIKDLIDSIINNYPIGTIILWKPSNSSFSKVDPFSKPLIGNEIKNSSEIFYVIDGQQRLTSLLLVFNNWVIIRDGQEIKCDIPLSYNPSNKKFYKSKSRGINLSDLVRAFNWEDRDLLKKFNEEIPDDQFSDMKEIIERILHYKIPIYIMRTIEENEDTFLNMAEAFIRVNKFGVRIGNLELMLSFLAGAISGELKTRISKLFNDFYKLFEIELQPIIRFTFSNFGLKQTQISRVEQFKKNVERIEKIEERTVDEIFTKCNEALTFTISLISTELGITNSKLLPSQIPLITIASYLYNRNIQDIQEIYASDVKNIISWFIVSSFNGYYSSATDTKLDEDLSLVKSAKEFPISELFENMKKRKAKIKITEADIKRGLNINILRREGRAYLFLLYILLIKNDADNWNGKKLRICPLNELTKHHIFPKEFLDKELKIDDPDEREILINNIGNITFINKDINSEIGDNPPVDYLEKFNVVIMKHFISSDKNMWKIEQFHTFLDYRVNEIYNAGKKYFREIFE